MKLLELCCGLKSITKEAQTFGYETYTVDINKGFKPDLVANILSLDPSTLPFKPDGIWVSVPCTWFSIASAHKHWNKDKTPKTLFAEAGIRTVQKTLDIIEYFSPCEWWIENPRGMMRHLEILKGFRRETVTYCQYGETRRKPTDIWTNNLQWKPRPMCADFGAPKDCHPSSTDALITPRKRAMIPVQLCKEIVSSFQF